MRSTQSSATHPFLEEGDLDFCHPQPGEERLSDVLVNTKIAGSDNEARRLIDQGVVWLDNQVQRKNIDVSELGSATLIRVGQRRVMRL